MRSYASSTAAVINVGLCAAFFVVGVSSDTTTFANGEGGSVQVPEWAQGYFESMKPTGPPPKTLKVRRCKLTSA